MSDAYRPDPDALLATIQKEEAKDQRGSFKIFFGMAAGVGKTYAMLEAAQQHKRNGVDVVIGYLEPHGRPETIAKAEGLEVVPTKRIEYKGSTLQEVDVEAIIKRAPRLVLVDELAHTNAPGSTHPKRYMDVQDLLNAGIDVYTTVNVQHIESRADAVAQITGVTVHETIPDTLIDMADEIELIDLEPDELIKRLGEGKVYATERAQVAIDKFFRKGNLTALREMALRLTAERVDHQLQDYMQVKHIAGPWKSGERLMVAVSASPLSERLIRWTRRMAYNLEAPWIAVYVESPQPMNDAAKAQLNHNLSLVHKLDGEIITTSGTNTVDALMRVARQRNVTQIVMGKPQQTKIQEWMKGGSLVNRLVRQSGEIDVYVVSGDEQESDERLLSNLPSPHLHSGLNQYTLAAVISIAAVAICFLLENWPFFRETIGDYRAISLILLTVVVVLGNFVGRGPILLAAALSAILWDLLFIPPTFTLFITHPQDFMIFLLYFVVAVITGNLTARARNEGKFAIQREGRMSALYTMANQIAEASTIDEVLKSAVQQVGEVFNSKVAITLPQSNGRLANAPHAASTLALDEREIGVASYAFEKGEPAGRFTDTLSGSSTAYHLPLVTPGGVAGILSVDATDSDNFAIDQRTLLQTFANHIALAVERELLDVRSQQAAVIEESERMYAALLDSISHELRTPLTTIKGATSSLVDPATQRNPDAAAPLAHDILDATARLDRLVENLLDMSRIESGHIQPRLEWCDVRELIDVSLKEVEREMHTHDVVLDIAPDLPLVRLDFTLMQRVTVNLLYNAAIYSPPEARIRVIVKAEVRELVISVADRGPGLPPDLLQSVFVKFWRAPGARAGGTGLGLSICKALVEAHGGTISAENRPTRGGARFTIRIPMIGEAPKLVPEAASQSLR